MGWFILWVVLVLLWLKVSLWASLLTRVRPWRLFPEALQPYQRLIVRLEQLKTGFLFLNWLLTVIVVTMTGFFVGRDDGLLVALIVAIVVTGVVLACSFVTALQQLTLRLTRAVQGHWGTHLRFLLLIVKVCKGVGDFLFPEAPLWYDEREMASFVEYHQRRYKQVDKETGKQLVSMAKIDEHKIGPLSVSLKDALLVKSDDTIGPILLKELHDSPYSAFGVYEEKRAHLVGILEQGVALSHAAHSTKVKSLMDEHIVYLTPDTSFKDALHTFMETNTTLAAIVDENSKPISVLYLRDIMRRLFGE